MKRPTSAFIGAGRLAQALAPALAEAGWPVLAIGAREPERGAALAAQIPGCQALAPAAAAAAADWVWLAVGDAQLAAVAAGLAWRAGQLALHAAGATGLEVLAPAAAAGAHVAGFHPLQLFAGGRAALGGCGVGIEAADAAVRDELLDLATALGLRPLLIEAGARKLYHAGANLAASGVLAVLSQALEAWAAAGLTPQQGLELLLPLTEGALAAARERGLAGAVAGPVARGDAAVLGAQLAALGAGEAGQLYRLLARRQLALAQAAGRLKGEQIAALSAVLAAGA